MTKHIYAGDQLIATVEDDTPSPKTYYNHLDHLNSTTVTTDTYGYTTQLLSYYPFGSARIDDQLGDLNQTKRFTGHDYDTETNLTYAGARYLHSDIGRFTSQDPLHIRLDQSNLLTNPQKLNSYSYVVNNPLIKFDATGESDSLAMFWGNMQRVDNVTGGYVSNEIQVYAEQAPKALLAAGVTVAAVPAVVSVMSVAPYATVGALTNMGAAAAIDVASDGSYDMSGQDLATNGVIGALGGQFAAGRGLIGVGTIAAGDSIVSQTFTGNGQVSGREVLVDTGVAVGLHGMRMSGAGSPAVSSQHSYGNSIGEVLTNISAKLAAWSVFLSGNSDDSEEDDNN